MMGTASIAWSNSAAMKVSRGRQKFDLPDVGEESASVANLLDAGSGYEISCKLIDYTRRDG